MTAAAPEVERAQGRSLRHALAFVGLAGAALGTALIDVLYAYVLAWPIACWLAVASAYAGFGVDLFGKRSGRVPLVRKLLLLPHVALLHGTWHLIRLTSREPPFAWVTDTLMIGRRLLPGEFPPMRTLVDLTAELDEHVPAGVLHVPAPILDGAALPPESLRRLATRIAACEPPIYIHCAQGHGRTAMVTCAVLLELGVAQSPSEALEMVQAVRPAARLSRPQFQAVVDAWQDAGSLPSVGRPAGDME